MSAVAGAVTAVLTDAAVLLEEVEVADDEGALAGDGAEQLAQLAQWLEHLREARRHIGAAERTLETALAASMPRRVVTLEDHGLALERRAGNRYVEWDDPACASRVAAVAVAGIEADRETGELVDAEHNPMHRAIVGAVVGTLLRAARPSWRVTVLRELGLDPENYARVEAGRPTVQVRKWVAP